MSSLGAVVPSSVFRPNASRRRPNAEIDRDQWDLGNPPRGVREAHVWDSFEWKGSGSLRNERFAMRSGADCRLCRGHFISCAFSPSTVLKLCSDHGDVWSLEGAGQLGFHSNIAVKTG